MICRHCGTEKLTAGCPNWKCTARASKMRDGGDYVRTQAIRDCIQRVRYIPAAADALRKMLEEEDGG